MFVEMIVLDANVEEKLKNALSNFLFRNVIGLIDQAKALGVVLMKVADKDFVQFKKDNPRSTNITDDFKGVISGIAGGLTEFYPLSEDEQEEVQKGWTKRFINYYDNQL